MQRNISNLNGKKGFVYRELFGPNITANSYVVYIDKREYHLNASDFILTGERKNYPEPKFSESEIVRVNAQDSKYLPRHDCEGAV